MNTTPLTTTLVHCWFETANIWWNSRNSIRDITIIDVVLTIYHQHWCNSLRNAPKFISLFPFNLASFFWTTHRPTSLGAIVVFKISSSSLSLWRGISCRKTHYIGTFTQPAAFLTRPVVLSSARCTEEVWRRESERRKKEGREATIQVLAFYNWSAKTHRMPPTVTWGFWDGRDF